jgi:hypothetical protein
LTPNLFGIDDPSRTPNKINWYVYREFPGKKGRNTVASLLMQDLHDKFPPPTWLRWAIFARWKLHFIFVATQITHVIALTIK